MRAANLTFKRKSLVVVASFAAAIGGAVAMIGWLRTSASAVDRSVAVMFDDVRGSPDSIERGRAGLGRIAESPGIARRDAAAPGTARPRAPSAGALFAVLILVVPVVLTDAVAAHAATVRYRDRGGGRWRRIARSLGDVGPNIGVSALLGVVLLAPTALAASGRAEPTFVVSAILVVTVASALALPVAVAFVFSRRDRRGASSASGFARLRGRVDGWLERLGEQFHESIATLLSHRTVTAAFVVGELIVAVVVLHQVGRADPIPAAEPRGLVIELTTSPDSGRAYTASLARTAAYLARSHPEIASASASVGVWATGAHAGRVVAQLFPRAESESTAQSVARTLRSELSDVGGAEYSVNMVTDRLDHGIDIVVRGPDSKTLFGVAQRILDDITVIPGAVDVRFSMAAVARKDETSEIEYLGEASIAHILANVDGRKARPMLHDLQRALASIPLPPGYSTEIRGAAAADVRAAQRTAVTALASVGSIWLVVAAYLGSAVVAGVLMTGLFLPAAVAFSITRATAGSLDWWSLLVATVVSLVSLKLALPVVHAVRERHLGAIPARVALIDGARAAFRPTLGAATASVVALAAAASICAGSVPTVAALGASLTFATVGAALTALFVVPASCDLTLALVNDVRDRAPLLVRRASRSAPGIGH